MWYNTIVPPKAPQIVTHSPTFIYAFCSSFGIPFVDVWSFAAAADSFAFLFASADSAAFAAFNSSAVGLLFAFIGVSTDAAAAVIRGCSSAAIAALNRFADSAARRVGRPVVAAIFSAAVGCGGMGGAGGTDGTRPLALNIA
jgi:hypothetical protein